MSTARIAGEQGGVHALDKYKRFLDKPMQKAQPAGLANIKRMDSPVELRIALTDACADEAVLDTFRPYYVPQAYNGKRLLDHTCGIKKPFALPSGWLKHMQSEARAEIENADFAPKKEHTKMLAHDNNDHKRGKY
jgi:hypothetical protein